ncbi:MAG: peptidoglycan-binding domain-containing protein [Pyrinomonadaceae bacterium]
MLSGAAVCELNCCGKAGTQTTAANGKTTTKAEVPIRRGPVFRANKGQIVQAQTLLKQAGHFTGEAAGKLDPETRSALRKYQASSGLKETGTLNRVTLDKMGITLTDKQKAI